MTVFKSKEAEHIVQEHNMGGRKRGETRKGRKEARSGRNSENGHIHILLIFALSHFY